MKLYQILPILALTVLSACAPQSKEAYLDQFQDFIAEVKQDHDSYSQADWDRQDETFRKFTGEWHDKFSEELSIGEELTVAKHALTYNMLQVKNGSSELLKALREDEDVQKLKDEIEYYVENDMEGDLKKLIEEARKAGDETSRALQEILKELDVEIDAEIRKKPDMPADPDRKTL